MATLTEIRQALAAQIKTGIADDTNVVWYSLSEDAQLGRPRISIRPDDDYVDYGPALNRSSFNVRLVVRIEPGALSDENFAAAMDRYLDPADTSSVVKAIDADPTLGGLVMAITRMSAAVPNADSVFADIIVEALVDA